MAPVRETYVPVPGIDYIEPASEKKFNRSSTSLIDPHIPLSSTSQKTPSKATSKPKTPKSATNRNKNSRSTTQDSARKTHASNGPLKPREVPLPKSSSTAKTKASSSQKGTSKPAEKTVSKVLSTERVTASDDEDSDAGVNGRVGKEDEGGGGRAHIAEKGFGNNGVSISNGSVKTNGLSKKRAVSSASNLSPEKSNRKGNGRIKNGEKVNGGGKLNVLEVTNGLPEKRARSMSSTSSSESGDSNDGDTELRSKSNVPSEARKRKSATITNSQAKTDGSPANRARSSSSSESSTISGSSGSVSHGGNKMDVDESASDGLGPSAQPDLKINGTASQKSWSTSTRRQDQSKQQGSTSSSDNDTENITSNSADSSTSGSEAADHNNMDTSASENITSNAITQAPVSTPKRAGPSSRTNLEPPASYPHPSGKTSTTTMPAITPPPPPEPLSQSSLSSLSGKQIWHITLPANVPIGSIRTIPSSALSTSSATQPQTPVIVHDGADYMLSRGSAAEERDAQVFVAAADNGQGGGGLKRLKRNVNAVWHVRQAPKLPNFHGHERPNDSDASEAVDNVGGDYDDVHESSDSSEPIARPLPQGLKMRWLPSGCASLSSDSEDGSTDDIRSGNDTMSTKALSHTVNTSDNRDSMQGLAFRRRNSQGGTVTPDDHAEENYNSSITGTDTRAANTSLAFKSKNNHNNNISTDQTKDESKSKSKSKSKSEKRKHYSETNGDSKDLSSVSKTNNVLTSPQISSTSHQPVHPTEKTKPSIPLSATANANTNATSPSNEAETAAAKKARKEEKRQRQEQKALKNEKKKMQMQNGKSKDDEPWESEVVNHEMEIDKKRRKQEKKERKERKEKKRERKREKIRADGGD